jgi:hypothetical protein
MRKYPEIWTVRDAYTGRRLCLVVGDRIRERLRCPARGRVRDRQVYCFGEIVAVLDGHFVRGRNGEVVATISEGEILEGIDGPLLARFDGGIEVGLGGAAFLFRLLGDPACGG